MDPDREGTEPDARFTLAAERTLLAYVRTGLALVAGGAAVSQLPGIGGAGALILSLTAIAMGITVAVWGHRRWRAVEHAMRTDGALPPLAAGRFLAMVAGLGLLCVAIILIAEF